MARRRLPTVRRAGTSPEVGRWIGAAVRAACLIELEARKPGNVRRGRGLPGLPYALMARSARVLEPVFARHARGRVGRLIFEAVRATRRVARTNTNLGIILLLAPLARAATRVRDAGRTGVAAPPAHLRDRLHRILAGLDRRDARDAYRAIRLARPGGLGRVPGQDVRGRPTVSLGEAMRLAAHRDAIACEYATGYALTFDVGLPALRHLRRDGVSIATAVAQTFLVLLASRPDTLIRRRHGDRAAHEVSHTALKILQAGGFLTARGRRLTAAFDRRLSRHRPRLNPGATADLSVAALFVWLCAGGEDPASWPRGA